MKEENKESLKDSNEQDSKNDNILIDRETPKKRHSRRFKVLMTATCVVLAMVLVLGGYLWHLLGYYKQKDFKNEKVVYQEEQFDTDGDKEGYQEADPESIIWKKYGQILNVEGITNILLCAEENQEGGLRGRSDVIMIATIDANKNTVKLTSVMRDTYVQIPGFLDNRINTAYRTGDIPLLEETIKENFNISVDGYVKVDFESFTKVIDALGGVEITLTAQEAEWLNQSNHILDENSRNVTAGTHILNGSQALGYTRIRKIPTANGLGSDFGRVWRQKHVLMQVFNQYKNQSILDILGMAPDILQLVQTDYSKTEVLSLVKTVMDLDVKEIETMSIPVKNGFSGRTIRGMDVLVPDLQVNNTAINEFIYGNQYFGTVSQSNPSANQELTSTYN